MTLLLPYLLSKKWAKSKLRVITTPADSDNCPKVTLTIARLLSNLRIQAEIELALPNYQRDFDSYLPQLEKKTWYSI